MSDKLNTSLAPFNRLTSTQQQQLLNQLDVAYFRDGDRVICAGQPIDRLHIIIKGVVEEHDAESVFSHYTRDDLFDVRAQFTGESKHDYTALEDTLCYLLPSALFTQLCQQNRDFANYFDSDLATRQTLLESAQQQQNLAEFILTRIDDSNIQPSLVVNEQTSIMSATKAMRDNNTDCAFISPTFPNTDAGIITRTDLLHALLLQDYQPDSPVGPVATHPVISVEKGDYLFNAMIAMTRHKVKRVLVYDGEQIAGMLDLTQVLSLFSTHSHVLTLRIARATTIEELALAAHSQTKLVENLLNNGIHTRFVMALIAAVNEQIIEKAFALVVPQSRQQDCCLMVLGSEGRGEQILKTDQDNALVLADDVDWPECHEVMTQLSQTLAELGYPLCPGKVMVNNPEWVKTASQWQTMIRLGQQQATAESLMPLAMLADAHAVAGNSALLTPLRDGLQQQFTEQQLILATFVLPAMQFAVPLTLFGNVKADKEGIDLKKGGIFPIVHGVRTLALEAGIVQTNTFARLEALQAIHFLEPTTVANLSEALKLFIKLRLQQQLKHHSPRIVLADLQRGERDLLRHSLHVVKKFRQWLGFHYQLRD